MKNVTLPQSPKFTKTGEHSGKFEILGCYPGYGTTLGNALRRVLLSSLSGAAVVSVKIKGVSHEFSTIPGVMEDAIQIILNLKKVRFKKHTDELVKLTLKYKGEGKVTAKEIKCPSSIEVVNPEQLIATATDKKVDIEMEIEVENGLGYVPVEQQAREEKHIGVIAVDAVYTPVRRVNYAIENMRVGKRTDYDKITLEIDTDGSISPEEAFHKATELLVEQFSVLLNFAKKETKKKDEELEKEAVGEKAEEGKEEADPLETEVVELKSLSTRTLNVLNSNKVKKVKDIVKMSEEEIKELEGMGSKGIKEIKKAIGDFGLTLK